MYEEEVATGAALLVKRPGWERELDLGNLHLEDCRTCVLGQLYGWYAEGLHRLDPSLYVGSPNGSIRHGFALPRDISDPAWAVLTETWVRLVKERFDSGTLSG